MDVRKLRGGFTLVELLVTISVVIIFISVAIPSFNSLISNNSFSAEINRYLGYLQYARSEAITHNTKVMLCPSSDGLNCTGGTSWNNGLIIYHDDNNNRIPDNTEKVALYIQPGRHDKTKINSTVGRQKLTYRADGTSPGSNVTITFCGSHPSTKPKAIIVNNIGRPRVSKQSSSGGVLNCS